MIPSDFHVSHLETHVIPYLSFFEIVLTLHRLTHFLPQKQNDNNFKQDDKLKHIFRFTAPNE